MHQVENNSCSTLNRCIQKGHEFSSAEIDDKLSELPNEVLLLILSFLTTKEVRRTSVISRKWNRWLLGYYPKLNFEDSRAMENIHRNNNTVAEERSSFVPWVDRIVKQYLDSSIEEFRVAFDLDDNWQSYIDRWVDFALKKQVKTLELDFRPGSYRRPVQCGFTPGYCKSSASLNLKVQCGFIPGCCKSLASLSLNYVNITSEVVENILVWFPFLENLCITKAEFLTRIKAHVSILPLKHLDVSCCAKLQTIDISAPNMVFFRYFGQPIELNIQNAVSLSSLFIGGEPGEDITYAFEPISKYLPQLEVLYLRMSLRLLCGRLHQYTGIEHLRLPLLTTLKMLELHITASHTESLLGWTPLIEACPVLEKLTAKFDCYDSGYNRTSLTKRRGTPLKSIKTLELFGYRGRRVDIEFAATIFENAINLREVIVEVATSFGMMTRRGPARVRN